MNLSRVAAPNAPALTLLAAAAAWPSLVALVKNLLQSPLERALQTSWCGDAHAGALFTSHCAACWIGSATLIAAAMIAAHIEPASRAAVRIAR